MTDPNLGVFIGRFQPFHSGHLHVVKSALRITPNFRLLVCLGSANDPRRADYIPFTWQEREQMIRSCLTGEENKRVICLPIEDSAYNLSDWVASVQEAAAEAAKTFGIETPSVHLIGHAKDHSSFYLKLFPQWASINVENHRGLSATPFRLAYFSADEGDAGQALNDAEQNDTVPAPVLSFLWDFMETDDYRRLVAEQAFIEKYKMAWSAAPYKPMFVTTDAVVVQGGNILLIERKAMPGQGLWALPGGFLEQDERIEDGILRELREETGLKIPTPVLKGSMVGEIRVFDAPHRSSRGRTITHAALIHLQPQDGTSLPKVKGLDDAAKAKWWPIAEIHRGMMFEDHMSIIRCLLGRIS